MSTHALTLAADEATATALAEAFDDYEPSVDAVALFEQDEARGVWALAVYFGERPDKAAIEAHLAARGLGELPWQLAPLPKEDWVARSLEGLGPVRAGRYTLCGSHDRGRLPANVNHVEMDAGQAFGTGHHGTTRGCLMLLSRLLRLSRPRRILDVGTGTGVLAIAAARSLRQPVLASDIDPVAVQVARANATRNGVAGWIRVVPAAGLAHPEIHTGAPYDLIMANILAGPLLDLAPAMRRHGRPGGRLILSGLLETQAPAIVAAYRAHGFLLENKLTLEGWTSLVMRHGA